MSKVPTGFVLRPHQVTAVTQIRRAPTLGQNVLLAAPTGTGKSVIAAELAGKVSSAVYLADEIHLVEQMARDHARFVTVHGHANYCPAVWKCSRDQECPECGREVTWVGRHLWKAHEMSPASAADYAQTHGFDCPYRIQKLRVIASPFAALNTQYFLTETMHVGDFANRDLVLLDEADQIINTADRAYGAAFSAKELARFGFEMPGVDHEQDWLRDQLDHRLEVVEKAVADALAATWDEKELYTLANLKDRVVYARKILVQDVVVTISETQQTFNVRFVDVAPLLAKGLWLNGNAQFVAMSATPGPLGLWCRTAGADPDRTVAADVPHTFPAANRQVRFIPGAPSMSRHGYSDPERVTAMAKLIARETANTRGLVLVNSLQQMNALAFHDSLVDRAITHLSCSDSKQEAVRALAESDAGLLISASMWRGVDLIGDICRAVVIAKIPWADLGDPLVKARMERFEGWYEAGTATKLVQGAGRGVRGPDDHCRIIVVDGSYPLRRLARHYPEWFREAHR